MLKTRFHSNGRPLKAGNNISTSKGFFQKEVDALPAIPKMIYLGIFVGVLTFFCPSLCSAYIDPGTGFTFVSGIGALVWGVLALFFGGIVLTFKKWFNFLKGLFKRPPKNP